MEANDRRTAIAFVTLCVVVVLLVWLKICHDKILQLEARLAQPVVTQATLGDGTTRSSTTTVSAEEASRVAADGGVGAAAGTDVEEHAAHVVGVSVIMAHTPGQHGEDVASTSVVPRQDAPAATTPSCAPPDPYGYQVGEQRLKLTEPTLRGPAVPVGEVGFSAWKEKPWNVAVLARTYALTTMLAQDEDGVAIAYSKFWIQPEGGERVEVPITEAKLLQVERVASWGWNPELFLGLSGGATAGADVRMEAFPSLGLALASYGKTRVLPTFAFLSFGIGIDYPDRALLLSFDPVLYNLGDPLPLVRNAYVGPTVAVDSARTVIVGVGLRSAL